MNRITNKKEVIESIGCTFHVYRKRKKPNIFTTTLWRKSLGYVFNLSTSLVWWAKSFPSLFPDWNVRVYFDNSVFTGVHGDPTDWTALFKTLLKHPNIELWFYQCPWGADKVGHKNTFGSLIRFHAFDDPDTEVVVSHNLEYLTSPKDRERIYKWLESGKKYHVYTSHNSGGILYSCVGIPTICIKNNMYGKPSLMATFALRKNRGERTNIFYDGMRLINDRKRLLNNFKYGVDEIVLTLVLKPKITTENTFVSVIVLDYKNIEINMLQVLYKAFGVPFFREVGIPVYSIPDFSYYLMNDIDLAVKFFSYTKSRIEPYIKSLVSKKLKSMEREGDEVQEIQKMKEFLTMDIKIFINNVVEPRINKNILTAFLGESDRVNIYNYEANMDIYKIMGTDDFEKYIYLYEILLTNLFYCIDFPGSCVKNKDIPVRRDVAEQVAEQETEEKKDEGDDEEEYSALKKSFKSIFLE